MAFTVRIRVCDAPKGERRSHASEWQLMVAHEADICPGQLSRTALDEVVCYCMPTVIRSTHERRIVCPCPGSDVIRPALSRRSSPRSSSPLSRAGTWARRDPQPSIKPAPIVAAAVSVGLPWSRRQRRAADPRPAEPSVRPAQPSVRPALSAIGSFVGSDQFHFGRGTAHLIETAPGTFAVRLQDFAVRNETDLYAISRPDASGVHVSAPSSSAG